ncbi:hypothetical protein ACFLRX_05295 [Acidobacteriota bacterium]
MFKKSILNLGVIFLLALSPALMGQSEFRIMGKSKFVIVPPSAFNCMTSSGDWIKSDGAEQYLYIRGGVDIADRIYMAPVYFPPTAKNKKVTGLSVTVSDESNLAGISVRLRKTDLVNGNNHWMVFFVGTGLEDTPGKVLLSDNTTTETRNINNEIWAWDLLVAFEFVPTPEDLLRLYSVRIEYK